MSSKRVGLIGHGAIGQAIVAQWLRAPVAGHALTAVLVRPRQQAEARAAIPAAIAVVTTLDELLAHTPALVVEAAGHGAVIDCAQALLTRGLELMLLSIGSLADAGLHARLERAALASGGRMILPVGAIAGLDGLLALRRAGLQSVRYTSTKPPAAWRGTPAEAEVDLAALGSPTIIFDGNARDAARRYPKNANIAAAVALAGLGFERTRVQLIADPAALGNSGRIEAEGEGSRLDVTVAGRSTGLNPKSSQITGMSVLSALDNQAGGVCFG
jgi:aspartate dehydrogenase